MSELRQRRKNDNNVDGSANEAKTKMLAETSSSSASQLEAENDMLRERIAQLERQSTVRAQESHRDSSEEEESNDETEPEMTEEEAAAEAVAFARAAAQLNPEQKLGKVDLFFLWFGGLMVVGALLFIFNRMGRMLYRAYVVGE